MNGYDKAKLLATILNGADILDMNTAMKLRQVKKETPVLIDIVAPMHDYKVDESRAYFGAKTTKAGEDFVRKYNWCDTFERPASLCGCPDCGSSLIDYPNE